jgi:methyl-accepting chemotaxis protein
MKWFLNMKTAAKLILGFLIVAAIAGVIGGVGEYWLKKNAAADKVLYEKMTAPLGTMIDISMDFELIRVDVRDMIYADTQKEREDKSQAIEAIQKAMPLLLAEFKNQLVSQEGEESFSAYSQAFDSNMNYIDKIQAIMIGTGEGKDQAANLQSRQNEAIAILKSTGAQSAQTAQTALVQLVKTKLAVARQTADQNAANADQALLIIIAAIAVGIALSILLGLFIARTISKPLNQGVDFAEKLAENDLTHTMELEREDEVGVFARALTKASVNLREQFTRIASGVQTLAAQATELASISKQMSDAADATNQRSNAAAAAAEQMSANMSSVSSDMEQTSTNISTVATATEEMTSTIGEIAGNSEKARGITTDAVEKARIVSMTMTELGKAAQEIGKVTEAISAISSQTNLLALNATIEAARAGQAGRGFAVVANEIKELAKQTATATEDIKSRIDGIQSSTVNAVDSISQVVKIIEEVNEIVTGIAASIEEQSTVTKDIANNVAQAAKAVEDTNHNVAQASTASGTISQGVAEVNQAASEIATSSAQVHISSEELSKLSEGLRSIVERFKV